MADFFVSECVDPYWGDSGWDEPEEYSPCYKKTKICKYCGAGDLVWGNTEKGFRLFDANGKMHSCPKKQKTK